MPLLYKINMSQIVFCLMPIFIIFTDHVTYRVYECVFTGSVISFVISCSGPVTGMSLRRFTTVPCRNTSSLPSKVRPFESIPVERNAATRERNIFRAGFPPILSRNTAYSLLCKEFHPKTACGSLAEARKGHAGEGN